MKAIDIAGQRYGRLVALWRAPNKGTHTQWAFACDCGTESTRSLDSVRSGAVNSCGCLAVETVRARSEKHGHSKGYQHSRTWRSWSHAKGRCFNPRDAKFPQYGGRGITMCGRWANDFRTFLADLGECPEGKTLDRVNPDGHYEPGNCRWATSHEQARTRTDNVFVEHDGERLILKDFAARRGVSYKSLHARIKYRGQPAHQAAAELLARG